MTGASTSATSPWRTSRWWATTALVALGVIACLGLGAWQYDRARTRDTPTGPSDPMAVAPLDLAAALPAGDRVPPGSAPRAVAVTGRYDAEHTFLVPGRTLDGQAVGYAVTPLHRVGAPAVLVVRGAVPDHQDGFGVEAAPPPSGEVTVTGWLAPAEPLEAATVDPLTLPPTQLASVTPARVLGRVGYPLVDGYVGLVAEVQDGTVLEANLQQLDVPLVRPGTRWSVQSLGYAVEWWFFALAGVWMWVQALRIERRRQAADAAATAGPGAGGSADAGSAGQPAAAPVPPAG